MAPNYRILRDNKERGPMSLEELLGLSLKPFDLIWVEGRSAGWRYPGEIESLKPYVQASPPTNETNPQPLVQAAALVPPPSPPMEEMTPSASSEKTEESEAGVLTEEKLQARADAIYQKIQAFSSQQQIEEQGVQTKYARSLDDLKQEYADWLHKKKEKRKFSVGSIDKKLLIGGGLMACAVAFLFFLEQNKDEKINTTERRNYISNASFNGDEVSQAESSSSGEARHEMVAGIKKEEHKQSVDAFIDSVEKVLAKGEASKNLPYRKMQIKNKSDELKTVNAILDTETILHQNLQKPEEPVKEIPISQQVNMNAHVVQEPNRKNIASLEVTIQNNSRSLLKTVAVDVFYYKRGERLFDKETLYFNNIQPGNSVTLSRPGNRKAITARFQLGQIDTLGN